MLCSSLFGTNTRSESSLDKGEPESEWNVFIAGKVNMTMMMIFSEHVLYHKHRNL